MAKNKSAKKSKQGNKKKKSNSKSNFNSEGSDTNNNANSVNVAIDPKSVSVPVSEANLKTILDTDPVILELEVPAAADQPEQIVNVDITDAIAVDNIIKNNQVQQITEQTQLFEPETEIKLETSVEPEDSIETPLVNEAIEANLKIATEPLASADLFGDQEETVAQVPAIESVLEFEDIEMNENKPSCETDTADISDTIEASDELYQPMNEVALDESLFFEDDGMAENVMPWNNTHEHDVLTNQTEFPAEPESIETTKLVESVAPAKQYMEDETHDIDFGNERNEEILPWDNTAKDDVLGTSEFHESMPWDQITSAVKYKFPKSESQEPSEKEVVLLKEEAKMENSFNSSGLGTMPLDSQDDIQFWNNLPHKQNEEINTQLAEFDIEHKKTNGKNILEEVTEIENNELVIVENTGFIQNDDLNFLSSLTANVKPNEEDPFAFLEEEEKINVDIANNDTADLQSLAQESFAMNYQAADNAPVEEAHVEEAPAEEAANEEFPAHDDKFDFLEKDEEILLDDIMDDDLLDDDDAASEADQTNDVSVDDTTTTVVVTNSDSAKNKYQPEKREYGLVAEKGVQPGASVNTFIPQTAVGIQTFGIHENQSLQPTSNPYMTPQTNIIKPKKSIIQLQEEKKKSNAYDFPQDLLTKNKHKPLKEVKENIYTHIESAALRHAPNTSLPPSVNVTSHFTSSSKSFGNLPPSAPGNKFSRSNSVTSNKSFFAELPSSKVPEKKLKTSLKNPYAPITASQGISSSPASSVPYTETLNSSNMNPYAISTSKNASTSTGTAFVPTTLQSTHVPPLQKKISNPYAPAAIGGHVKQLSVTTVDPDGIKPNIVPVPTKQTLPLPGLSSSTANFSVPQNSASTGDSNLHITSGSRVSSNKYAPTTPQLNVYQQQTQQQLHQPAQPILSPTGYSYNGGHQRMSSISRRSAHKPRQSVSSINEVYGSNIVTSHATSTSTRKSTTLPPIPAKGSKHFTPPTNGFTPAPVVINPENLVRRQWPLFSFSGVDKVASMIPNIDAYNHNICKINVHDLSSILKVDQVATSFPGPLLKSKTKKKDVIKFINDLLASSANVEPLPHAEELIWKCLLVMLEKIENQGDFANSDYIKEISIILNPSLTSSDGANTMFDLIQVSRIVQNYAPNKPFNSCKLDESGASEIQRLLETGDKNRALEFALMEGDWAMALIVAHLLGNLVFTQVVKLYTMANLQNSSLADHLNFFIQTTFKETNIVEQLKGKERWIIEHFKFVIPFILTNNTGYGNVLSQIGEALVKAGFISYGKLLFILSGLTLIPKTLNDIPSSLKGMVIEEIYDYILSSSSIIPGNLPQGLPHMLPLKIRHAGYLADIGLLVEAKKYCDNVQTAIASKQVFCEPSTYIAHAALTGRLSHTGSGWLSSKLSRPQLDRVWNTLDKSFNKFVSGEDTPLPESKTEGVFSKFTSPASLSRTPSNLDLVDIKNNMMSYAPISNAPLNPLNRAPSGVYGANSSNLRAAYPPIAHNPVNVKPMEPLPQTNNIAAPYHGRYSANALAYPLPTTAFNQSLELSSTNKVNGNSVLQFQPPITRTSSSANVYNPVVNVTPPAAKIDSYPLEESPMHPSNLPPKASHAKSPLEQCVELTSPPVSAPPHILKESICTPPVNELKPILPPATHANISPKITVPPKTSKLPKARSKNPYAVPVSNIGIADSIENSAPVEQISPPVNFAPMDTSLSISEAKVHCDENVNVRMPDASITIEKPLDFAQIDQIVDQVIKENKQDEVLDSKIQSEVAFTEHHTRPDVISNDEPFTTESKQVNEFPIAGNMVDVVETDATEPVAADEKVKQPPLGSTESNTVLEENTVEPSLNKDAAALVVETETKIFSEPVNEAPIIRESTLISIEQPVPRVATPQQVTTVEKANDEAPSKSVAPYAVSPAFKSKPRITSKNINRYGPASTAVGTKKKSNPYASAYAPKVSINASNHYAPFNGISENNDAEINNGLPTGINDIDMFSFGGYSVPPPINESAPETENENPSEALETKVEVEETKDIDFDIKTGETEESDVPADNFIPTFQPPTQVGVKSRKQSPHQAADLTSIFSPPTVLADKNILKIASPIHQFTEEKRYIAEDTGEYYDEVIDESDDEDDKAKQILEQKRKQEEERRKKKEEEEEKKRKEDAEQKKNKSSKEGGWFGWIGKSKNDDKPKPIKAKLGEENSFYYDEKLKRWINKKQPLEEQLDAAKPPPPPAIKKPAASASSSASTSSSALPLPPLAAPPALQKPTPPTAGLPLLGSGAPPKKEAIDDLLSINTGAAAKRSGRRGPRRGYVDVMGKT